MNNRTYIAIDLKSFYASVECAERHLDPLTTNLVVADASRTEKTICLAVSPSLKAYGISGRARLFEVIQRVKEINAERLSAAPGRAFSSSSFHAPALAADPSLELSYIVAPPQMQLYMDYSTRIYNIYLRYIAPEDIHVYSIDEVFLDVTEYLSLYQMSARDLCMTVIRDILYHTGITATGGIGTNLYLAKVAMDIVAKKVPADQDGVRIAELDEISYRQLLWTHMPLTDFWQVGPGYARRLMEHGMYTMGDVARCSVGKSNEYFNEELLYKLFGIRAEILIDHAWGYEPTTIPLIKSYVPENSSLSSGQVLHCPYTYEKALLIVKEMTDLLVLDMVDKGVLTDQLTLTIGYDRQDINPDYKGPMSSDFYGRLHPRHSHGSVSLGCMSSSTELILPRMAELFEQIANPILMIRRINITANHIVPEHTVPLLPDFEQLTLFTDYEQIQLERQREIHQIQTEKRLQKAMISIKKRFGKNAVLKGMNLLEGGRTIERNMEIGGHRAG